MHSTLAPIALLIACFWMAWLWRTMLSANARRCDEQERRMIDCRDGQFFYSDDASEAAPVFEDDDAPVSISPSAPELPPQSPRSAQADYRGVDRRRLRDGGPAWSPERRAEEERLAALRKTARLAGAGRCRND